MTLSLVRGKHVVCRVTGPDAAEVVADGAVLQRDGQIEAVGDYRELSRQHPDAEVIGSGNHIFMPGLVNADGSFHLRQRRLMQPQFHHIRISEYAQVMADFTLKHEASGETEPTSTWRGR